MNVTTRADVNAADFGGGEAGSYILDTAYFFGALVVQGDLHSKSKQEFNALLGEAVLANPNFSAAIAKQEGAQLAVVIEGNLYADYPFHAGRFEIAIEKLNHATGSQFTNQPELSYCLGVGGNVQAPAFFVDQSSHASISGDLAAQYVHIDGSDGELLFCGGRAQVTYYIHDHDQPEIAFVSPPTECRTHEIRNEYRTDEGALLAALEKGENIVAPPKIAERPSLLSTSTRRILSRSNKPTVKN